MKKIFTLLLVLVSLFSFSQSTTLVISQVYGAGGNAGATYNADFVELHNISSSVQSTAGLSIQYGSSTSTTGWTGISALPTASIPAGGYYLIQMSASSAVNGIALPTPDYLSTPTISMGGSNGKVALVNGTTAISGSGCPFTTDVIDAVGYGTANCFEGAAPTAAVSTTTSAFRNNNGCTETNQNGSDFTVDLVAPRNSASPVFVCGGGPPSPALSAGTVLPFGNVVVSTNSASQSFNVSGTNLTGAPGTISITSPSSDFQVSNNNTVWGASTTIPYASATLAATPVYVRFTPQSVGPKSGNVNIFGGGVTIAVTVAVSGNGILPAGPAVSFPTGLGDFGAVCINTTAGPGLFNINGTNLTAADLVVGPFTGYTFSTTSGGTYTASLTLTHPAGSYSQDIYVQFTPTTAGSYDGNIPVTGGGLAAPANVAVTGSGSGGSATVTTGSASAITMVSATLQGTLPAQGCSPVTAYGFEYSTVSGFINGTVAASTNLSGVDFSAGIAGLASGTTYYYKAFATNAAGTVYGVELSFITSAPPPASLVTTTLTAFGSTCPGSTLGPNPFDITGTNFSTADLVVGPLNGYTFSTSAGGTYSASLTITQPGGSYNATIYVKFTPASIGTFAGNIPITGAGLPAANSVAVTGIGFNGPATVTTGNAVALDTHNASNNVSAAGDIPDIGCSQVFSYGIEYSSISGFENGTGLKVPSNNLSGTTFSSILTGLIQNTDYYFKAYAENNAGIAYGLQNTFKTKQIAEGLIIYSTPIIHGQNLHFSVRNLKKGHYTARIHNSIGQLVYQKDFIIQVDFMDNNFIVPINFPIGLYNLEVKNFEYRAQKSFMIQ